MKELSTEEKAKAYDEAIERARKLKEDPQSVFNEYSPKKGDTISDYIFPKLKESEDERIRKSLIEYLHTLPNHYAHSGVCAPEWIAWLEKQGEKKSNKEFTFKALPRLLDMIEPTDKAKAYCQKLIDSLENEGYTVDAKIVGECLKGMNGEKVAMATMDEQKPTNKVEPKFYEGEWITNGDYLWQVTAVETLDYILKSTDGNIVDDTISHVDEHFHLWTIEDAKDGDVLATSDYILIFKKLLKNDGGISYCHYDFGAGNPQFTWLEDKNWYFGKMTTILPATKEQRDLLFKKMHEAGYEWTEKKELKKIVDEEQIKKNLQDNSFRRMFEQNPAWSEEDDFNLQCCIDKIQYDIDNGRIGRNREILTWLKFLKDRCLPQPKQEWKPSERDLESLTDAIIHYEGIGIKPNGLKELFEQLKKLREE